MESEPKLIFLTGYLTGLTTVLFLLFVKNRCTGNHEEQQAQPLPLQTQLQQLQQAQRPVLPPTESRYEEALVIHILPSEKRVGNESCLVCLETLAITESSVECNTCHAILGHAICLEKWFQRNLTCPHCRTLFFDL